MKAAALADRRPDKDGLLLEPLTQVQCPRALVRLARFDSAPLLLELFEVAGGRLHSQILRNQVIAGVAIGDLYDLALMAQVCDVVHQDYFHLYSLVLLL